MTNLTADQSRDFKEIILNYLLGEDISGLEVSLQTECSKVKADCKSIYKSIKLGNCGVVEMDNDPTAAVVNDVFSQLHHKDGIIAFNDQLYFADHSTLTIELIKVNERNADAVEQLKENITEDYRQVNFNEMALIRTVTGNPNLEDDPLITAILGCLNIQRQSLPDGEESAYETMLNGASNLHELLLLLCHSGHYHLRYLTKMIESTRPKRNWTLAWLLSTVSSAGFGIFFFLNQQYLAAIGEWFAINFPTLLQWLGRTFSLLRNIPILGIIYRSVALLWNWVEAFRTGTTTKEEKRNGLFFKTLAAAFSISSYVLTFLAGGIMAAPAAFLSVLSSATDAALSCYHWYKSQMAQEPESPATWEEWAEYYRADSLYQQNKKIFYVNIIAAVLTTAAVAIWCFLPPMLVVTIACLSFMAFTAITSRSILSTIEDNAANKLQETLANDIPVSPEENLLPSKRKVMVSIIRQQERQRAKEIQLHTWEQELQQRVDEADLEIERRTTKLNEKEVAFEKYKRETEAQLLQREATFQKTCDSTVRMLKRLSSQQHQNSVSIASSHKQEPAKQHPAEEFDLDEDAPVFLAEAANEGDVVETEFRCSPSI